MKKLSLAVVIAGIFSCAASAQTNVTITGQLDNGYVKETGKDARMWRNHDNLIRFKGSEDLGNGTKAVFNLENRLNPNDGTRCSGNNAVDTLHGTPGVDWQGAANVGLVDRDMGSVLLGRTSSITVSNYSRVDPFGYDGIAASGGAFDITYSGQISNSIRYDSPTWNGLSFSGSYSLGKDTHQKTASGPNKEIIPHSYGNDGFAAGLVYENGGLLLLADYERLPDSDKSWSWDAGAAYTWGDWTFSAGYHAVTVKAAAVDVLIGDNNDLKQKNAMAAVSYQTGPHKMMFTYNWLRAESDGDYDGHANKYALGYVYSLSKRTSLYGTLAYTDNSNDMMGKLYNGAEQDSTTGVQFGVTHKF